MLFQTSVEHRSAVQVSLWHGTRQHCNAFLRHVSWQGMEQLAEKANLSTNFIGAIERGLKEPSLSTLISILNALDIPADVLLRDYVGTASHVTDEEICKRLEGLTPIQKKAALDLLDTYIANLPYLTNEE